MPSSAISRPVADPLDPFSVPSDFSAQSGLPRLSRRGATFAAFASLVTLAVRPRAAAAQAADHPPALNSGKNRFVQLDPAKPMPAIKLLSVNGKPVELAPSPGKPLLVNFWATWSDASQTELPKLDSLQQAVGKGLDIAAIAHDGGGRMAVEPFLRSQNIKHLSIYLDPDGVATGIASATRQSGPFVLYSTPMSYMISPRGLITGYIAGPVDWGSETARALIDYFMRGA
jgi:cytochrome c biogenesis protein CcmG/thiol:disulfide interchange protein DsbE